MKEKDKQKIIPVPNEALSSKDTEVVTPTESLGSSNVDKSLSRDKSKCKNLYTSDKNNSTNQVDAEQVADNRHFRKKEILSYAEVLAAGKDTNNARIESTTIETPKITQNEGVIDLAAVRSVL